MELPGASGEAATLTWALPKGRILEEAYEPLEAAGLDVSALKNPGRKLVVPLGEGHQGLLLKPWDVATYVELGVAHMGLCGSDVLVERQPDVYELLDLGIGACRLSVARPAGVTDDTPRQRQTLRVASKYVASARAYYAGRGEPVDIIKLYGSVELAAITQLADVVVDLVSTGKTLAENDLVETEVINQVSTRLVVNVVAMRVHGERIRRVLRGLASKVG